MTHYNSVPKHNHLTRVVLSLIFGWMLVAEAGGTANVNQYQIIPCPPDSPGGFGWSMDSNGSQLAVSAAFSSALPRQAFIYNDNSLLSPPDRLVSPSAFSAAIFGQDISISSDFAIVGSLQEEKAFLFDIHTHALLNVFACRGDAVAVDGNRVAVGWLTDSMLKPGFALLYDATTGQLIRRLSPADYTGDQLHGDWQFGGNVVLDGDTLLVSSAGARKTYAYDANSGNLRTTFDLYGAIAADHGRFLASTGPGKVSLFDTQTGQKLMDFLNPDPVNNSSFGGAAALEGDWALLGSPLARNTGPSSFGAAYLFNTVTGDLVASFYPNPANPIKYFGGSVAITNNHFVIGSRANNPPAIFVATIPEPCTLITCVIFIVAAQFPRRLLRSLR